MLSNRIDHTNELYIIVINRTTVAYQIKGEGGSRGGVLDLPILF